MSREPLPPRPEKESSGVSEAIWAPSDSDGAERRVVDRVVVDTSPLQRALAGLTTAGEWAAQADAEERKGAERGDRDEPDGDQVRDVDQVHDSAIESRDVEVRPEPDEPSLRAQARERKAQVREARRAEKLARRAARKASTHPPVTEPSVTEPSVTGSEPGPTGDREDQGESPYGESVAEPAPEPRIDTRSRRAAAKQARRAAALERREARARAKSGRAADRDGEAEAVLSDPADADAAVALEPDEIDRELAVDEAAVAEHALLEKEELAESARREAEQVELERVEAERVAAERLEAERLMAEEIEVERRAVQQAEIERAEAERIEAERAEAEHVEAGRLAAAAVVTAPLQEPVTPEEPEVDWEDVERRAAEAADAVSARAAAREQKALDRQRRIEAKAAARLGRDRARRGAAEVDDVPEPPDEARSARGTSLLAVGAAIVGAGGLILSVVLAVGAMLAALGTDSGALYSIVSAICDALTAPLAGLVDFSGANAEQKEALVAWGLGSIVYLAIGLGAQSVLRSRTDDD